MSPRARRGGVAGPSVVAAWVCLASAAAAPAARADVRDDAERIAGAWRAVGASVVIDRPRFLNDDETIAIALPGLPDGACTTVVLLGVRGLGFHVSSGDGHGESTPRLPSEAGLLSIERCQSDAIPARLLVTSDSGRGAVEMAARSEEPLPSVQTVLPERTGGGLGPMPEPGALPALPPPEKRADVVEARARRDGASVEARATWHASGDGSGAGDEVLQPGCHTVQLFASDPRTGRPSRQGKLDLDAEMHDGADDRLLARDRTDAPDAQLPVCVGETTQGQVAFVGAPPNAAILVSHVAWPLPKHLPALWGADTRARMARVLLARGVVSLPSAPVQLAQGGSGATSLPVALEPGGCYVALVALAQGSAHALGLRVLVGAHSASDDRGIDDAGAAVAFCAGARTTALVEVEAHGTPLLGWGLALYRLTDAVWDIPW